jgi:hypothetical protein
MASAQCEALTEFSDAQSERVKTLTAERDVLIAQLADSKASSRAEVRKRARVRKCCTLG